MDNEAARQTTEGRDSLIEEGVFPPGAYHRRIVVVAEDGHVRAGLEDEPHRVEMVIRHNNKQVTGIEATTPRIPWTTCPGASEKIRGFVGLPLQHMHVPTGIDGRLQCTHMYDLARLAMARALVGQSVQYDVTIPDLIDGKTQGILLRDGEQILCWDVDGASVTGPDPFTEHIIRGVAEWPAGLDDDTLEAALVLRRGFFVSGVRTPAATQARNRMVHGL